MSSENLLERCLGGHNQNNNKCLNSTIWRLASKYLHIGSKIIESCIFDCRIFNESYVTILKIMKTMSIIGQQCKIFADCADKWRTSRNKDRSSYKKKSIADQSNIEKKNVLRKQKTYFVDQE